MANQGYFPSSEADRTAWLAHFRTKLPVHCVDLGFTLDDIAGTLADIDFYIWLLQSWNPAIQKNAMEASAFKALIGTVSVDTHLISEFTVITERGMLGERVKLMFTKYSHDGVIVESRRGDGDWEVLGVVVTKPWYDERDLLVANVPEIREYRLRWWDKGIVNGEYTAVQRVNIGP